MTDWWDGLRSSTPATWACRIAVLATGWTLASVLLALFGGGVINEGWICFLILVVTSMIAALWPEGGASWFTLAAAIIWWWWKADGRLDGWTLLVGLLLLVHQTLLGWLSTQPGWLPAPPGTWRRRARELLLVAVVSVAGVGLVVLLVGSAMPGTWPWTVLAAAGVAGLVAALWAAGGEVGAPGERHVDRLDAHGTRRRANELRSRREQRRP